MKAFVYGTLKKGQRNSHILEHSQLLGTGETVAKCRLYHAGFPVLRRRSKTNGPWNAPVRGEVYEVDDATLARLDRLESNGRMYHRRVKKIRMDTGEVVMASVYVGDTKFWRFRGVRMYSPPPPAEPYVWSDQVAEAAE